MGEYSPTNARGLGDGVFFGTVSGCAWMSIQKDGRQFQMIAQINDGTNYGSYKLYYRTINSWWAGFWYKLTGTQVGNDEISQFI